MVCRYPCGLDITRIICVTFPRCELKSFCFDSVYIEWVSCVRNSSYRFEQVFLKFSRSENVHVVWT